MGVRRRSALSLRRVIRYSDLEVNIRSGPHQHIRVWLWTRAHIDSQGSSAPFPTKSSVITPTNPSALVNTIGGRFSADSAALIPATTPCAAASSYPVVPVSNQPSRSHLHADRNGG
jgi:hypothetical protein